MFTGSNYDPALDETRLKTQLGKIYSLMIDGRWRTLREIEHATGYMTSSISAQLRNLKKLEYGHYIVDHRRRGDKELGLFEYQLLRRGPQPDLFQIVGTSPLAGVV
ncbi:MAG: hypothetical protein WC331_11615 [Candidatus Omnitrophota bacterium]|jgi:hypothetical protein